MESLKAIEVAVPDSKARIMLARASTASASDTVQLHLYDGESVYSTPDDVACLVPSLGDFRAAFQAREAAQHHFEFQPDEWNSEKATIRWWRKGEKASAKELTLRQPADTRRSEQCTFFREHTGNLCILPSDAAAPVLDHEALKATLQASKTDRDMTRTMLKACARLLDTRNKELSRLQNQLHGGPADLRSGEVSDDVDRSDMSEDAVNTTNDEADLMSGDEAGSGPPSPEPPSPIGLPSQPPPDPVPTGASSAAEDATTSAAAPPEPQPMATSQVAEPQPAPPPVKGSQRMKDRLARKFGARGRGGRGGGGGSKDGGTASAQQTPATTPRPSPAPSPARPVSQAIQRPRAPSPSTTTRTDASRTHDTSAQAAKGTRGASGAQRAAPAQPVSVPYPPGQEVVVLSDDGSEGMPPPAEAGPVVSQPQTAASGRGANDAAASEAPAGGWGSTLADGTDPEATAATQGAPKRGRRRRAQMDDAFI